MTIKEISDLFDREYVKCKSQWAQKKNITNCKTTISKLSEDDTNQQVLCKFKNTFFGFDYIAKEFGSNEPSTDMIFFDIDNEYIVLVEYKNGKIKDKKDIQSKFLNSFSLLNRILKVDKKSFWSLKTHLIFVTNKEKNKNQLSNQSYQKGSFDILNILQNDIIFYGFGKYKPWYFDQISTPFCDEFTELMKQKFNITLEEDT